MVSEAVTSVVATAGGFSGSSSIYYFRIMLVLSITLFLLLFLEVALCYNTHILLHDVTRTAMWIVLWIDSMFITLIIPAIIGSNFLQRITGSKRRNSQQQNLQTSASTSTSSLFGYNINHQLWLRVMGSALGIYGSTTFLYSLDAMVEVIMTQASKSLLNSLLATWISRICAFGLAISSAINGFGSVSLPYTLLVGFLHEPISPKHMASVQEELEKIQSILQVNQYNQNRCSKASTTLTSTAVKSNSTWYESSATITSNGTGTLIRRSVPCTKLIADTSPDRNNNNPNHQYLHNSNISHMHPDTGIPSSREIATMEELYLDLTRELEEMRCIASASSSSTKFWCSRYLFRTLGFIFSMVLMLRLCLAIATINSFSWKSFRTVKKHSLHYGSSPERLDPITRTLRWLVGYNLVSGTQVHMISQGCSLILTFVLSYSQVGNFLYIASEVSKRFYTCCSCIVSLPKYQEVEEFIGRSDPAKQCTRPHPHFIYPNITSIIMGSYFLSCVVVIGTMLPEHYRAPLVYALHGATFSFHPYYFDLIYTLSATITLALFASITRIRRQNSLNRYLHEEFMDSPSKEQRHLDSVC